MGDILNSFKNKKSWQRLIVSTVIFFAVALPFRRLLALMPGITEIRPANVIPPVLGLIWGPPAAFGIAIGNLVSDIFSGSGLFICVTGFIANFFYAYLPYKLWYSFKVTENDVSPTLGNVGKMIKYIYIIFLDSAVVTGTLSLIFETAGFSASADSYLLLFFNNFDFAVLLGVPLLILIEKFNPAYYVPQTERKKKGNYLLFDVLLFAAAAIGVGWFFLSLAGGRVVNQTTASVLLGVSILLTCTSLFKPFNFDTVEQKRNVRDVKITIKSKVTIGFMLLAVIFIVFIGVTVYNSQAGDDPLTRWSTVYNVIGLAINIIFSVAIGFLWYVERNIVNPLELLSEGAKAFAARPANTDEIQAPEYIMIDTGDEISLLARSFNFMMLEITDYMQDLKNVTAEKERIGAELSVATHIQASMLPCIFPAFPGRPEFDIYATMQPAKEVGGDFYDFFLVDDNHLAMVMADVSGKGVPAALFMVISKTLVKNISQTGMSPKLALEKANNQLCENNEAEMFVTVWLGILEISTGKLTYANAGHEHPAIRRAGGEYELILEKHGFVLAGMENSRYKEYTVTLNTGDRLYLYTDGVAEATNAQDELYGTERMVSALNRCKGLSCREQLYYMKDDIDRFVGQAPQFDDITMLSLEMKGNV